MEQADWAFRDRLAKRGDAAAKDAEGVLHPETDQCVDQCLGNRRSQGWLRGRPTRRRPTLDRDHHAVAGCESIFVPLRSSTWVFVPEVALEPGCFRHFWVLFAKSEALAPCGSASVTTQTDTRCCSLAVTKKNRCTLDDCLWPTRDTSTNAAAVRKFSALTVVTQR